MWIKINIETKLKNLEKISCNVDSLCTDYYVTVLNDQDMTKTETSLLKLEERMEELEISLNQLLNSDVKETRRS